MGARQYTLEEMQAIVDEAHTQGMTVAAHAHRTEGVLLAIKAGVAPPIYNAFVMNTLFGSST